MTISNFLAGWFGNDYLYQFCQLDWVWEGEAPAEPLVTLITSPDYVWIAESLNPTHVSITFMVFTSENCDCLILKP